MRFLKENEYNDLLINSQRYLPLKAKIDRINILIDQYNHGKNIYTVMRDIKNIMRSGENEEE